MIIITLDESLDAQSVKIYTGTNPADVTRELDKLAQERYESASYTITHKGTPKRLDMTFTSSNPNCIQVGARLFCW